MHVILKEFSSRLVAQEMAFIFVLVKLSKSVGSIFSVQIPSHKCVSSAQRPRWKDLDVAACKLVGGRRGFGVKMRLGNGFCLQVKAAARGTLKTS